MPRNKGRKRQRGRGGQGNHGRPNKKRRLNDRKRWKLSEEESTAKMLQIIKTLQDALSKKSMKLSERSKITETEVGIKVFLNDSPKAYKPISANLKHKYEDFVVSEIDESGNTVKITDDASIKDADSINKDVSLHEATSIGMHSAHCSVEWIECKHSALHSLDSPTGTDIADGPRDRP